MPVGARVQAILAVVVLVVAVAIVMRDPARRKVAMEDIQNLLDTIRALKPQV